ncbi:amino acid ABC transporter substrate-binding protein, PAAT family [Salegentibacter echinorum]|uniref:Amino acid ABC transporter substrate-binding protein, PAAT family n=1 Tax=Salegentibacter echinorum TaxID=1073325 RepID=A0A1M5C5Y0_SALEC|nr:transporter substrate-binding domain-containing protein [Salegentibacter echinorum]SHF50111.1 amino acid ABC transporter substrate-binding protein, PAAT family [Salegentibacter echinorum]
MIRTTFYRFLIFVVLCAFASHTNAQSKPFNPSKDTLVISVAGNDPFIVEDEDTDELRGISIDIWEEMAYKNNWQYRYISYPTVNKALKAVEKGDSDLAIGPISITSSRVKKLMFSQPYYQSSLAIGSRADGLGLWGRIKPLFSLKLLIAVGVFLFILAIVGTLLWLAEHKASPEQFPRDPKRGIGNGMWLAIVTMSTTGYGDMAPVTLRGRIVAGIWMVITIIFATSMVAGIASTLTLTGMGDSTITKVEELANKKSATVAGSPATTFVKEHKSKPIVVDTFDEALKLLDEKKVDAVVYDRPQLLYFQQNNKEEDLYVAKAEYYKQGYGFAFPLNSEFVYQVNLELLKLAEEREIEDIVAEYLGKE